MRWTSAPWSAGIRMPETVLMVPLLHNRIECGGDIGQFGYCIDLRLSVQLAGDQVSGEGVQTGQGAGKAAYHQVADENGQGHQQPCHGNTLLDGLMELTVQGEQA